MCDTRRQKRKDSDSADSLAVGDNGSREGAPLLRNAHDRAKQQSTPPRWAPAHSTVLHGKKSGVAARMSREEVKEMRGIHFVQTALCCAYDHDAADQQQSQGEESNQHETKKEEGKNWNFDSGNSNIEHQMQTQTN